MHGPVTRPGWLALLASLLGAAASAAGPSVESSRSLSFSALPALQELPEQERERIRVVLEKPTFHARGPLETFRCQPPTYHWLLDHPDRAVKAWLRLGAKCTAISDRGNGRFGCKDKQGNDVYWDTLVKGPGRRVWYAEGVVKPSLLLPQVPVKAVIILHVVEGEDSKGRPAIRHQGEVILNTDSKVAALAARMLGMSAPRVAEQYVGQLQTFFGALAWYLSEHPDRVAEVLAE